MQTGGPSGGCIPEQFLDMPVDYDSLAKVGSIMGSGGMIVMDETSCMVDVAKFFMEFCMTEIVRQVRSLPRRHGPDVRPALTRSPTAPARWRTSSLLEELCDLVKNTSLCGLGRRRPTRC